MDDTRGAKGTLDKRDKETGGKSVVTVGDERHSGSRAKLELRRSGQLAAQWEKQFYATQKTICACSIRTRI